MSHIEKHVAIIVLNWQGWRDTIVCLESLRALVSPHPFTIIVCDNASNDDSFVQILNWAQQHYTPAEIGVFAQPPFSTHQHNQEKPFLPFVLIQTGANRGFAGGHNVGICYALANPACEYLWLLNNDITVDKQALAFLWKYARTHPQIALFGSTIVDYYQHHIVQCAGGCRYSPLLTVFSNVLAGESVTKVLQQSDNLLLDYIYGASLFLRVSAVQKVGLLNEEYFLFYEELDYTQRLKQQGYEIGWCKNSLVYHKGSASIGNKQEGNRQKLQTANYYENLSTLKYTANFHLLWLPLVMIVRFTLKSLALIGRGEFYLFPPLFKAYLDFVKGSR